MGEPMKIVLLGKTGAGKSSLANTIFGQELFKVYDMSRSGTKECQIETRSVNGRSITLIDTPGFFDTDMSEEELKPAITKCITECSPGPHAFLILLKVERYTEHERAVINKIKETFSEEAFKYATVVFTHGDQLPEGQTIEDFVDADQNLRELVKKCGGRRHVIDNKRWKEKPMNEYRSNRFQVKRLLQTIDRMIQENNNSCYTNKMLQAVWAMIQKAMTYFGDLEKAKDFVWKTLLNELKPVTLAMLVGAFLGGGILGVVAYITTATATMTVAGVAVGAVAGGAVGYAAGKYCETGPDDNDDTQNKKSK